MKQWAFLVGAIISEVAAALSLKAGMDNSLFYIVVAVGYTAAFIFLTKALKAGMALGVAYGIWGASGVALTAVLSNLLFKEPLTAIMVTGIVVIVVGVLMIELGSQAAHKRKGERIMSWLFLIGAIIFEVSGTLSLRMASTGKRRWWVAVALGYIIAFTMLIFTLANGMALGVAYGIWAASGVALTAILSKIIFKEHLTLIMSIGILVVIGGVLMIELGSGATH